MSDEAGRLISEARRDLAAAIKENIELGSSVAAGLDKTLISLSGGALVFSMTFVGSLAPAKLWLPVLFGSWIAFGLSITSVVLAMRTQQTALTKKADSLTDLSSIVDTLEELMSDSGSLSEPLPRTAIIKRTIAQHPPVERFNKMAICAFIIGVVLLGVFVGHNLWSTS